MPVGRAKKSKIPKIGLSNHSRNSIKGIVTRRKVLGEIANSVLGLCESIVDDKTGHSVWHMVKKSDGSLLVISETVQQILINIKTRWAISTAMLVEDGKGNKFKIVERTLKLQEDASQDEVFETAVRVREELYESMPYKDKIIDIGMFATIGKPITPEFMMMFMTEKPFQVEGQKTIRIRRED